MQRTLKIHDALYFYANPTSLDYTVSLMTMQKQNME